MFVIVSERSFFKVNLPLYQPLLPFAATQLVPFITGIESRGKKPQINAIPNNPFPPASIHSTSAKLTK